MARLGLNRLRRLSRSQRGAESEEHGPSSPSARVAPAELPPSYETATGCRTQPVGQHKAENSPPVIATGSAPYRQTHQPPAYFSITDRSRPLATSTAPNAAYTPNCGQSLTEALSQAALAGKARAVRALLEAGAAIHESSSSGTISAIHSALRGPEPQLALLLLDYPCEMAYQGQLSPSTDATVGGEARAMALLSVEDRDGCTPLHLAASAGAADVVKEMLGLGAAVDARDRLGRTPLHMAARYDRADAMDVLLEHGAVPELVREELWKGASPKSQRELGDCAFTRRSVAKAVMRRDGVKDGEAFQAENAYSYSGGQGASTDDDTKNNGVQQRNDGEPLTGVGTASPRRSAAFSASTGGYGASIVPWTTANSGALFSRYQKGPAPSPAGFCTTMKNSSGRRSRRLPDVTMYSPEYNAWRKMCETVQAEHRRQKERNAEAGYGFV